MSSIDFCEGVVKHLFEQGVHEYCIASGSRNGALLLALSQAPVKKYLFIDERSAAFFALGRMKKTGRPVAVVCTSGTAVAEFLPATVEAHYSSLPLVLLTCDRPRSFRGTGAPQAIEQAGIFSSYVEKCWDLESSDSLPQQFLSGHRPVQLNLCLEEEALDSRDTALFWGQLPSFNAQSAPQADDFDKVQRFLTAVRNPLVLVSELSKSETPIVAAFLKRLGAPIYAEAISNLREDPSLQSLMLRSGEKILSAELEPGVGEAWDAVIRIGGVPTTRFWRDLDSKYENLPVLHLSPRPFKGLRRGLHWSQLSSLSRFEVSKVDRSESLYDQDASLSLEVEKLFARFPLSEPALMRDLSRALPFASNVYLGNSLPIREWDLFGSRETRGHQFFASRGANGIDGQVSTFLGLATESKEPTYAVLGDMTCLYDTGAFWIERQLKDISYTLFVINNRGGKIFSRVASLKSTTPAFMQQYLHQKHEFDFSKLAMMWDFPYASWQSIPTELELAERQLVEIRPNDAETDAFWKSYGRLAVKPLVAS